MRQACTHPTHSVSGPPRKCTVNARVHLSAWRVHFAVGAACRQANATCLPKAWRRQAKLAAAIAANLKELMYGG